MPGQHTTEDAATSEAILVPLDLDGLQIVSQAWLADGTIRVRVKGTATQATCPQCHRTCVKVHDTRSSMSASYRPAVQLCLPKVILTRYRGVVECGKADLEKGDHDAKTTTKFYG